MTGKPLHVHPEKDRSFAGAELRDRFLPGFVDRPTSAPSIFLPVVRLKDIDRERVDLPRRAADPVAVVFDNEKHRQLLFFRKTNRLEKIALTRRGIADCGNDEVRFGVELDAPGDAAGGEELRAGRGGDAPDVSLGVAVVRGHLPAVALPFALREIIERQLARSHAAAEDEGAVAIISADVITRLGRKRNRRQRFVPHARDVEMAFALAIEILFPQIAMPAFEQNGEETKFFFFAQSHRELRVVS